MTGGAVGVRGLHIAGMAGGAISRTTRNTGLHVRYGRMTEAAVTTVGDIDRRICGTARVVTVVARAGQGHVTGRNVVGTTVRCCISGMAIEAVGRVGAGRDGGDDFSPGAAVAGRAVA